MDHWGAWWNTLCKISVSIISPSDNIFYLHFQVIKAIVVVGEHSECPQTRKYRSIRLRWVANVLQQGSHDFCHKYVLWEGISQLKQMFLSFTLKVKTIVSKHKHIPVNVTIQLNWSNSHVLQELLVGLCLPWILLSHTNFVS